jgi:hypothetical protein
MAPQVQPHHGRSMMRSATLPLLTIAIAGLLAACATQPTPSAFEPPGFWLGLVHGFVSPFALIGGFFTNVRVYAFPNSGWWYDLGFMLGVGTFFGGGAQPYKFWR